MPDYSAGSASIKVGPNLKNFVRDARTELKAMDLSVDVRLEPKTAGADAQMQRFRAAAERPIDVDVDVDAAKAKVELDELSRARVANVEASIQGKEAAAARLDEVSKARIALIQAKTDGVEARNAELDALARDREAKIKARVDKSASSKAETDLKKIGGELGQSGLLNLKVLGVVGAAGAVADLLAIADAAGKATHALGLLPAVGFAGLAGAAAAKVGTTGLSNAFKAYTAAADPVGNAAKQRDALNAVSDAEYKVGDAERSVQTAQREELQDQQDLTLAYKDSERSIRDMNLSLDEQKIAVSDAGIAVREAAANLQKIQYDPTAGADQRQKALNSYQSALLRAQDARNKENDLSQDTATANAKGVEGSKAVVDAKNKVVDGIHAEADAAHNLQDSYQALTKAQTDAGNVGGQDKIAAALAKLSPNAKELVQDIHNLGPAWTDTRIAAQDALTAGIGPAVDHLADVQLPNLKSGFVGIDSAINSGLKASLAELSSSTNKADFKTSLDNTALGFANASKAAAPLTDSLTKLVAVGSQDLPGFGTAAGNAADKFNNLIQRTSADGSLKKWLDDGTTSAKELAQTAEHIGSSIASVFKAAGDGGQSLKTLDDLTAHMAAFLKSARGQTDLGTFFAQARAEGQKFEPILKDLPALLQGVSQGTKLWADIALPFLKTAADLLAANPHLVELAVAAFVGFKTVKPILDGAGLAIDLLAKKGDAAAAKAGGLGKFKAAGGELLSLMGNPWLSGLAVAAAGVTAFVDSVDKSSSAVQRFHTQALEAVDANTALQKALQGSGGKLDTGVLDAETSSVKGLRDALAANASDTPGLLDKAQQGLTTIVNSATGLGAGVLDNDQIRASADAASKDVKDAFDKAGLSNDQLAQKITGNKPSFDSLMDQLSGMGQGGKDAAAKLQDLRDEWAIDTVSITPVAKAIQDLGDKNKDTATSIDAATQALERQRQGGLTLEDAQAKVNQALLNMGTSAQTAGGAVIDASGKIDTTTSSGQSLYQMLNGTLAPAWEGLTSASYRNAIQSGATADQATADAKRTSDGVHDSALKQLEDMGYTQAQADTLLQHYEPLSKNFNATITADTSQATDALTKFQTQLTDILKTEGSIPFALQPLAAGLGLPGQDHAQFPSTQVNPNQVAPWQKFYAIPGHADGGPVYGPGTDTSDSILTRLSTGEYVINADAVHKYGMSLFDALNAESIDPAVLKAAPAIAPTAAAPSSAVTSSPSVASAAPQAQAPAVAPVLPLGGQTVTNPQAPLPGRLTDDQIQTLQDRSAVDSANSQRNAVYANPASTAQDKQAADFTYDKAQNAFEKSANADLPKKYTLPGIAASAAGILAQGLLDSVGLGSSVLSDTGTYSQDIDKIGARITQTNPALGGGYTYQPKNLPSVIPAAPDASSALGTSATPQVGTSSATVPGTSSAYTSSAGAQQWRGLATQALVKEGFPPTQANVDAMLAQIGSESGGNPAAVNNWDSNAKAGHPSQGLLQTIPSTFATFHDPSVPGGIDDAYANMCAALRYYRSNYGPDLTTEWGHGHGYADGGVVDGTGGSRSDGVPIWASPGEFVVNAYNAARNRPLLEAINASRWSPVNVPSSATSRSSAPGPIVNRDHSVQYNGPTYVMNPDELVQQQDRWVEQQSMGALAAYA